jgi:hypothetical protein
MESRRLHVIGRAPVAGALITACNIALSRRGTGEASPPVKTGLSRETAARMFATGRRVVQRHYGQAHSWSRKPAAT